MITCNLMGFDVSTQSVSEIVAHSLESEKPMVVNTINPHSFIEQKSDEAFRSALLHSDILIPDGAGFVLKN